ncbi:MAG: OmpA family protein, partial [Candidatus Binatia bacterium]|nr:OmpA family protein [Candidatus Binatia bacterium]
WVTFAWRTGSMPFFYDLRVRRLLAGMALGLLLLSSVTSRAESYEAEDPYGDGFSDSSSPVQPPPRSHAPVLSSSRASASRAPFGLSHSAAGALTGALLGAASGAIIGSTKGDAGPGAAIGAGIGAVSGYLVGRQLEARDHALSAQERILEQQRQEIARNRALLEELRRRNLEARETERGVVVNLPDVLFEFDSASLTPAARSTVAHIAEVLNREGIGRRVSVEGHTDAIGAEWYNLVLSQRRAETVVRELHENGVDPSRVVARGYGEKYPVAPNTQVDGTDNPAGRAQNRRVEVVVEN